MEGEGMMAVVRGLRDGLAVTLMDSGRQYTLTPETMTHPVTRTQRAAASQCVSREAALKESGVQATDGRYASTYKMMHCHMKPTSPPVQVTEFPPQRAELCYGSGNFDIGGAGSGETYCQATKYSGYKGGLCWTDRGSVFSARPSLQPDAFASSLRKYPSLNQDQSSEILEKLISFTQAKHAAVEMVSREVVTVPRVVPSLRTVAIPLTPTSSVTEKTLDVEVITEARLKPKMKQITQAVQSFELSHVTLQTAISSVELCVHNRFCDRRSRSQENIRLNTMETEIKHLLHALQIPSSSKNINCHGHGKYTEYSLANRCPWNGDKNEPNDNKLKNMFEMLKETVPETIKPHNSFSHRSFHSRLSMKIMNDQDLAHVIRSWLSFIPIQTDSVIEMELIYKYLFDLFRFYNNNFDIDWKSKLKLGILELLDLISIDSISSRRSVLNKLADILIAKVNNICKRKRNKRNHSKCAKASNPQNLRISTFQRHTPAKANEFKNIMSKEIKLLLEIFNLKFNNDDIRVIENDLIGIFTSFIEKSYSKNDNFIKNIITQTLLYHGLAQNYAIHFTDILMKQFKNAMTHLEPTYVRSENFTVFPTLHSSRPSTVKDNELNGNTAEAKLNTNLVLYTEELCKEINEWLDSLKISQIDNDKGFRQVVVHDLAGDIVDRHKYLELNPTSRGSDATELEYLKYQIFKWVNKLVEENNLKPIEYAADLMRRIQGILKPILSRSRSNEYNSNKSLTDVGDSKLLPSCGNTICDTKNVSSPYKETSVRFNEKSLTALKKENPFNNRNKTLSNTTEYADQYTGTFDLLHNRTPEPHEDDKRICSQNRNKECCSNFKLSLNTKPSTEQLNEEYEQFVKDWVQQIPIQSTNPEEEALADKARLGINNGIWKVVTKLNCEPAIYSNRFLYEDVLDDEVEDLINCLPQTPELTAKKHLLKVKLIEKTVTTIEQIYKNDNTSFKNHLIENVANVLRKHKLLEDENEPDKFNEELLIMKLVEDYILSTNYKDEDKVKAETYKNRLLKQIELLFDNLKKTDGNEIQLIDLSAYKSDILQTLQKVPLPDEESVKEEADDLLLGFQIEEWISDLPITFTDDYIEKYEKKKLRDNLVSKIKEMENHTNSTGDIPYCELQSPIKKFFEKTSIKEGESLNLDFLVDELTNRIKNRQKSNTSQTTKRVAFIEPQNYEDFKDDVPFSSSLIKTPALNQNKSTLQENGNTLKSSSTQCKQSCRSDNVVPINCRNNQAYTDDTNQSNNEKYQQCCNIDNEKKQPNLTDNGIDDNQWHTLHDSILSNIETIKKDIETQSPHLHPYYESKEQSFNEITSKNNQPTTLNNFNRSCCTNDVKDDDKKTRFNNTPNRPMYVKSDSSLQKHEGTFRIINRSQASQTRKGVLGIDQIAGCSKYDSENKNNGENCALKCPTHTPETTEYRNNCTHKPNDFNNLCCASTDYNSLSTTSKNPSAAYNSIENSISTSGCQTEDNLYRKQSQSSAVSSKTNDECSQRNVGTSASFDKFEASQEAKFVSTPKNTITPIIPRGPSKRRAKLTILEKDAVRKRIGLDDSEEDDEIRCRCIERSWKCKRRPKYYLCDEYEGYPPILPMFYPYPCFL